MGERLRRISFDATTFRDPTPTFDTVTTYHYRLLNVFAESTFGGNPLCVIEDARGMDDATMHALTVQFNRSETTFVLPSEHAHARVRIFTPGYEMRFAGHPALGTAHVVRALTGAGDDLSLEFNAGVVPLRAEGDVWRFAAPGGAAPKIDPVDVPPADIAALFGLDADDLLDAPQWVDTGAHQLLVPLRSVEAVRKAQPNAALLDRWPLNSLSRRTAYLFACDAERPNTIVTRYFLVRPEGGVAEDPGTGSACANLGGWWRGQGKDVPVHLHVEQGDAIGRPSRLQLWVDAEGVYVGGRVIELGRGAVTL